jgi:AcrR family transcriptional regulator
MTAPHARPSGTRERKKRETARAIEAAAVELAFEQGLGHVTVESISAAADVTSRTFFNYYASKEDAVLGNSRMFGPPSLSSVHWSPGPSVRELVLDAIREQLGSFDLGSRAFIDKKRALIGDNPQLLAKDFQSLGAIEADFQREVERLLAEEGVVAAAARADRAWAIVFSIGAVLRLAMHSWSSSAHPSALAEHIARADQTLASVV